ncbi:hypothetical protein KUTeg_007116 [Tegillarca granosa]|uniref:Synaptotagmin-like protein 5 n=1 Tax=Tegillarca granosa TaxID=220873 RepID=A0ABQ9FFJ6_TEGGR|nr:hypothetical protein KUTeg_007116 [Tegillarca granosa]
METVPNLDFLSDEEKRKILSVIKRDESVRMKQDSKIGQIRQEIQTLRQKSVLKAGDDLTKMCARCHERFGLLFNRGDICPKCKFRVCKMCQEFVFNGGMLCVLCYKQRQLKLLTQSNQGKFGRRASGSDLIKASMKFTLMFKNFILLFHNVLVIYQNRFNKILAGRRIIMLERFRMLILEATSATTGADVNSDNASTRPASHTHKDGSTSHNGSAFNDRHHSKSESERFPKTSDRRKLTELFDTFKHPEKGTEERESHEKSVVKRVTSKRYDTDSSDSSSSASEDEMPSAPVMSSTVLSSPSLLTEREITSPKVTHSQSENDVGSGKHDTSNNVQSGKYRKHSNDSDHSDEEPFSKSSTETQIKVEIHSDSNSERDVNIPVSSVHRSDNVKKTPTEIIMAKKVKRKDSSSSQRSTSPEGFDNAHLPLFRQQHRPANGSTSPYSFDSLPSSHANSPLPKHRLVDMASDNPSYRDSSDTDSLSRQSGTEYSGTESSLVQNPSQASSENDEYTVEEISKVRFRRMSKTSLMASPNPSPTSTKPQLDQDWVGSGRGRDETEGTADSKNYNAQRVEVFIKGEGQKSSDPLILTIEMDDYVNLELQPESGTDNVLINTDCIKQSEAKFQKSNLIQNQHSLNSLEFPPKKINPTYEIAMDSATISGMDVTLLSCDSGTNESFNILDESCFQRSRLFSTDHQRISETESINFSPLTPLSGSKTETKPDMYKFSFFNESACIDDSVSSLKIDIDKMQPSDDEEFDQVFKKSVSYLEEIELQGMQQEVNSDNVLKGNQDDHSVDFKSEVMSSGEPATFEKSLLWHFDDNTIAEDYIDLFGSQKEQMTSHYKIPIGKRVSSESIDSDLLSVITEETESNEEHSGNESFIEEKFENGNLLKTDKIKMVEIKESVPVCDVSDSPVPVIMVNEEIWEENKYDGKSAMCNQNEQTIKTVSNEETNEPIKRNVTNDDVEPLPVTSEIICYTDSSSDSEEVIQISTTNKLTDMHVSSGIMNQSEIGMGNKMALKDQHFDLEDENIQTSKSQNEITHVIQPSDAIKSESFPEDSVKMAPEDIVIKALDNELMDSFQSGDKVDIDVVESRKNHVCYTSENILSDGVDNRSIQIPNYDENKKNICHEIKNEEIKIKPNIDSRFCTLTITEEITGDESQKQTKMVSVNKKTVNESSILESVTMETYQNSKDSEIKPSYSDESDKLFSVPDAFKDKDNDLEKSASTGESSTTSVSLQSEYVNETNNTCSKTVEDINKFKNEESLGTIHVENKLDKVYLNLTRTVNKDENQEYIAAIATEEIIDQDFAKDDIKYKEGAMKNDIEIDPKSNISHHNSHHSDTNDNKDIASGDNGVQASSSIGNAIVLNTLGAIGIDVIPAPPEFTDKDNIEKVSSASTADKTMETSPLRPDTVGEFNINDDTVLLHSPRECILADMSKEDYAQDCSTLVYMEGELDLDETLNNTTAQPISAIGVAKSDKKENKSPISLKQEMSGDDLVKHWLEKEVLKDNGSKDSSTQQGTLGKSSISKPVSSSEPVPNNPDNNQGAEYTNTTNISIDILKPRQQDDDRESGRGVPPKLSPRSGSEGSGSLEDSGHVSGASTQENTPEHHRTDSLQSQLSVPSTLSTVTDSQFSFQEIELINFYDSRESIVSYYSNAGEVDYGKIPVTGEIQFGLDYNYRTGTLEIYIKQCKDLAPADTKRNRSDPYVKTYLLPDKTRSGKRKTKVKKHTLNPTFEETLRYLISKSELENRTLWVTVWHSDKFGRNDFLGEVTINFDYFRFSDSAPKWYSLQERFESPSGPMLSYKGDLIISLQYVPPDRVMGHKKTSPMKKKLKKTSRMESGSTGELHVVVKEARNLTAVRSNGTSDPFCKGYLLPDKHRSSKQKTPIVKQNCNPMWNHTFIFEEVTISDLQERSLELTLWDFDKISSNDFLGGVRLNLGVGRSYGKQVDWMDARGEEISMWQAMLDRPNMWIDGSLILRSNMDKRKY